jgi:hypothetical protein
MKPWKIQKFFGDVIYDLRQRNLLLVAILMVVGIVAVPVLLSTSGPGASDGPVGLTANASADTHPESESAVLAYQPGVRNFKKRLRDLSSKDPFKQQYANPETTTSTDAQQVAQALGGGTDQSTGSTGSGGGTTTVTHGKTTHHVSYFWWEADVQVGESGTELQPFNKVQPFTFLPSTDHPVLTYLGTVGGGNQALFLVSKDVTSVGGEGTCFPTADACQLLGLDAGKGADLLYSPDGKIYHVQVQQIRRVVSSKLPNF